MMQEWIISIISKSEIIELMSGKKSGVNVEKLNMK